MNKFDYFWSCVSGYQDSAVEVTLKDSDWTVVKEFAMKLGCAQFGKSLFIEDKETLKKFILMLKKSGVQSNTYVGVNPRQKIWLLSKKGTLYKGYRGTNVGVQCMKNIFVDVDADRKDPKRAATEEELLKAKEVATDVAAKLEEVFGLRGHIRLFTGNGYQMFFPLAEPVTWAQLRYSKNEHGITYEESEEFELVKSACRLAVQPALRNVEKGRAKIDKTWDLRRVGRLPWTRNWKDKSVERYCEIDYVDERQSDPGVWEKIIFIAKQHQQHIKLGKRTQSFSLEHEQFKSIKQLREQPIVQLLLSKGLPSGYRNHYLEMQLAILLRDSASKLDVKDVDLLLTEISRVQGRVFAATDAYLPRDSKFSPLVVNKWCALERFAPVYRHDDDRQWDELPPLDQEKLAEIQKELADDEAIERVYKIHYEQSFTGEVLSPSRDTEIILERMRNKSRFVRASAFKYACYCRGLVEKDDWQYWKEHWVPYEWASN